MHRDDIPSQIRQDPVLERRERAAADVVRVLEQGRAELARAQALLARIAQERNFDPAPPRPPYGPVRSLAPKLDRTLADTLFAPPAG